MADAFRIFLSSPSDVALERARAREVVAQINAESPGLLELVDWQDDWFSAKDTFQIQIEAPRTCDLVVSVFFSRLGSDLPPRADLGFVRADGTPLTGSEWEFEDAIAAATESPKKAPDILAYRKVGDLPGAPTASALEAALLEYKRLDEFWKRWFRNEQGHFVGAYTHFKTTDEFGRLLDKHLRAWLRDKRPEVTWNGTPFVGLAPFEERHASIFFGRGREIERVRARLIANMLAGSSFLMVTGASGSGKSSLLRAGVMPRIKATTGLPEARVVDGVTVTPAELGANWALAFSRKLFDSRLGEGLRVGDYQTAEVFAGLVERDAAEAVRCLSVAAARFDDAERRERATDMPITCKAAFIVDQFESLFFWPKAAAANFVLFLQLLSTGPRSLVLAAMRSDFRHRIAEVEGLVALCGLSIVRAPGAAEPVIEIAAPSASDVEVMIERPAAVAGLVFEEGRGRSLVQELKQSATGHNLPAVQFTLSRLYEKRNGATLSLAEFDALGGVQGALASHAEQLFATLNPDAQSALGSVIEELVTILPGASPSARRVPRSVFDARPSAAALVAALVDGYLIDAHDDHVRFAHDTLLLSWPRLREEIERRRSLLEMRPRLIQDFGRWAKADPRKRSNYLLNGFGLASGEELLKSDLTSLRIEAPGLEEYIKQSSRAARRRRLAFTAASGVTALVFAGLAVFASLQMLAAQRAARFSDMMLAANRSELALRGAAADWRTAARQALISFDTVDTPESRSAVLTAVLHVSPHLYAAYHTPGRTVTALAWAGEGDDLVVGGAAARLARFSGEGAASPIDSQLPSYSAEGEEMMIAYVSGGARGLTALTQDGVLLRDDRIVLDATDGLRISPQSNAVDANHRGDVIVAADMLGVVYVFTCAGDVCQRFSLPAQGVRSVAISNNGEQAALGLMDGTVELWSLSDRSRITGRQLGMTSIATIDIADDGLIAAAGSAQGQMPGQLAVLSPQLETLLQMPLPLASPVLGWSPDNARLGVTCGDQGFTLCVLETPRTGGAVSAQLVSIFYGHRFKIERLSWSPDSTKVATSDQESVAVWTLEQDRGAWSYAGAPGRENGRITALATQADIVLAGLENGALERIDGNMTMRAVQSLPFFVQRVHLDGDRWFATTEEGALTGTFAGGEATAIGQAGVIDFAPGRDGELIVAGPGGLARLSSAGREVESAPFGDLAPHGMLVDLRREVVFVSAVSTGSQREPQPGRVLRYALDRLSQPPALAIVSAHEGGGIEAGSSLAHSDRLQILATSSGDRMVRLYDTSSDDALTELSPLASAPLDDGPEIASVAFSADGLMLAAMDAVGAIAVWRSRGGTFEMMWTVPGSAFGPRSRAVGPQSIVFTSSGDLAVASGESSVRIVRMDMAAVVTRLERLTRDGAQIW